MEGFERGRDGDLRWLKHQKAIRLCLHHATSTNTPACVWWRRKNEEGIRDYKQRISARAGAAASDMVTGAALFFPLASFNLDGAV
jgi:hypothetical protein